MTGLSNMRIFRYKTHSITYFSKGKSWFALYQNVSKNRTLSHASFSLHSGREYISALSDEFTHENLAVHTLAILKLSFAFSESGA